MVMKLVVWLSRRVDHTSSPVDCLTAITTAGPYIPIMSKSPATVGVDLDTVQLTLFIKTVELRPVNSCKFFFQIRLPSFAFTAYMYPFQLGKYRFPLFMAGVAVISFPA